MYDVRFFVISNLEIFITKRAIHNPAKQKIILLDN